MPINLSVFNKVLRGTRKSSDTVKALDQANRKQGFAQILKGASPMIDSSVSAFAGNSAIGTRLRGTKLW